MASWIQSFGAIIYADVPCTHMVRRPSEPGILEMSVRSFSADPCYTVSHGMRCREIVLYSHPYRLYCRSNDLQPCVSRSIRENISTNTSQFCPRVRSVPYVQIHHLHAEPSVGDTGHLCRSLVQLHVVTPSISVLLTIVRDLAPEIRTVRYLVICEVQGNFLNS